MLGRLATRTSPLVAVFRESLDATALAKSEFRDQALIVLRESLCINIGLGGYELGASESMSASWRASFLSRRLELLYIRIYTIEVDISFDAAKNTRNIATRGISFERALAFE